MFMVIATAEVEVKRNILKAYSLERGDPASPTGVYPYYPAKTGRMGARERSTRQLKA